MQSGNMDRSGECSDRGQVISRVQAQNSVTFATRDTWAQQPYWSLGCTDVSTSTYELLDTPVPEAPPYPPFHDGLSSLKLSLSETQPPGATFSVRMPRPDAKHDGETFYSLR